MQLDLSEDKRMQRFAHHLMQRLQEREKEHLIATLKKKIAALMTSIGNYDKSVTEAIEQ